MRFVCVKTCILCYAPLNIRLCLVMCSDGTEERIGSPWRNWKGEDGLSFLRQSNCIGAWNGWEPHQGPCGHMISTWWHMSAQNCTCDHMWGHMWRMSLICGQNGWNWNNAQSSHRFTCVHMWITCWTHDILHMVPEWPWWSPHGPWWCPHGLTSFHVLSSSVEICHFCNANSPISKTGICL